ncbi:MAG TPA: FAD-dependent monooxygenase [Pseudonocardiaceae bacterium]|jgi:2-polyprenyl-6-methoxyphenol hydroxylase-like FAD-dependent oxidoreductase|nr:FAD-dependent monooxygenase [Pseudonocardiaceae bacterium]
MRVLIIGGGIAGTAAALALHEAGMAVEVFEAHVGAGEDLGAFLTLAGNGMLALHQFDAAGAVAAAGFPLTSMQVVDETGAALATVPLGEPGDPVIGYHCLRRADLVAALQGEVARRGIPLRHGARLVSALEDENSVTATFSDGNTAIGDLLIGADGLNSLVRGLIDPHAAPPRYAGQRVFYGYTAAWPDVEPDAARIDMLRGSTAAFGHTCSPSAETYWFARVPGDPLTPAQIAAGTPAEWREFLIPLLRRDNTPAAGIVAATTDRLLVTNASDLPDVPGWRTTRMLLIGDAAHAASPATGQGASMAFEDAVVLAKALRDGTSLDAALESYELVRRPRVSANIEASARMTTARMPERADRETQNLQARARRNTRTSLRDDTELMAQLDWATPLR